METKDMLEDYELGKPLAEGGQGLLRMGRRKSDGLDVVVKMYSEMTDFKNWESYEEGQIGAAREIAFLQKANADWVKGVPYLLDNGVTGVWKQPVAAFKPIPGQTLLERVSDPAYNPSLKGVLETFELIKEPLEYAHGSNGVQPVVHRDIKPENIYVNGKEVVVGDWAAATPTSGKTYHGKTSVASLYYTAPEVFAGRPFDHRADIYSLGKVLQLMLLGRDLFEATEGNPKRKDFKNLHVPKRLVKVLEHATAEKPEKRYGSVSEFYNAFEAAVNGTKAKENVSLVRRENNNLEARIDGEPSPLEIIKEMTVPLQEVANYEMNIRKISKGTIDFTKGFLPGLLYGVLVPYALITAMRQTDEKKLVWRDIKNKVINAGVRTGLLLGGVSGLLAMPISCEAEHPVHHFELSLFFIGANVASGIYEVGRNKYLKTREKLLQRNELEGKLGTGGIKN